MGDPSGGPARIGHREKRRGRGRPAATVHEEAVMEYSRQKVTVYGDDIVYQFSRTTNGKRTVRRTVRGVHKRYGKEFGYIQFQDREDVLVARHEYMGTWRTFGSPAWDRPYYAAIDWTGRILAVIPSFNHRVAVNDFYDLLRTLGWWDEWDAWNEAGQPVGLSQPVDDDAPWERLDDGLGFGHPTIRYGSESSTIGGGYRRTPVELQA